MSSMDHAIHSLKNNHNLRSRKKGDYFSKLSVLNKGQKKSNSRPIQSSTLVDDRKYRRIRILKIIKQVVPALIISLVCLYFLFGSALKQIEQNNFVIDQTTDDWILKRDRIIQNSNFKILLNSGRHFYKSKNYRLAQHEFALAQTIFPNRIDVNLELTKTILQRCLLENVLCDKAFAYYDSVINSPYLKQDEIRELNLIWDQEVGIASID